MRGSTILLAAAAATVTATAFAMAGSGGGKTLRSGATGNGDGVLTVGFLPRGDSFVAWLGKTPYRWVSPQGFVLRPGGGKAAVFYGSWMTERCRVLRDAGVEVWPWVWPVPGKEAEFWGRCTELVALGCRGVLVDAEKPYYALGKAGGITKAGAAQAMAALMQARPGGVSYGLLTYGAPSKYHPGFPWAEYAADGWVLPMVYRSSNKAVRQTVDGQRSTYNDDRFTPVLSADYSHKLSSLRATAAQARQVYGSIAVWHYGYLRSREVIL